MKPSAAPGPCWAHREWVTSHVAGSLWPIAAKDAEGQPLPSTSTSSSWRPSYSLFFFFFIFPRPIFIIRLFIFCTLFGFVALRWLSRGSCSSPKCTVSQSFHHHALFWRRNRHQASGIIREKKKTENALPQGKRESIKKSRIKKTFTVFYIMIQKIDFFIFLFYLGKLKSKNWLASLPNEIFPINKIKK